MEICYLINQIYKDGSLVRAPFLGDPVVSGIDEKRLSKKKWLVKERNFRGVTINDLKDHLVAIMKKESDNIIIHVEIIDKLLGKPLKSDSHIPKKMCVICFIESPLKMTKNAFYFILKALFVL